MSDRTIKIYDPCFFDSLTKYGIAMYCLNDSESLEVGQVAVVQKMDEPDVNFHVRVVSEQFDNLSGETFHIFRRKGAFYAFDEVIGDFFG